MIVSIRNKYKVLNQVLELIIKYQLKRYMYLFYKYIRMVKYVHQTIEYIVQEFAWIFCSRKKIMYSARNTCNL